MLGMSFKNFNAIARQQYKHLGTNVRPLTHKHTLFHPDTSNLA